MRLLFYSFILLFLVCGAISFAQVIVPSFHGAYTSKASAVIQIVSCGAYTAPGVYKEFMCHNLGADTSLDPHTPVQGIHGNYYQWGRIAAVANASNNSPAIAGWNTGAVANGAWGDGSKTTNDPCPLGYRVPTIAQWTGVISNNTVSRTGTWVSNDSNFTSALHFGTSTTKTLTFPASGSRQFNNGVMSNRGSQGLYWSSTNYAAGENYSTYLFFTSSNLTTENMRYHRSEGTPVRCIKDESSAISSEPDSPTNPVVTAGNGLASVSFTVSVSDGGSAITGYTVTSSPGSFTSTGENSPIVVSGLTNGRSYTFTVFATNAVGNSVASSASGPIIFCGAYTAPGVYKEFLCHNLGADTSLDPHIPVQGIHGNYYQWGRIDPVANASTAAGVIAGWNTVAAPNGAWTDASKTVNDPCPVGYRVPTSAQWAGLIANNTLSRTGSWANSVSNFTTALHFGTSTTKTLTFPTSGLRQFSDGVLSSRGSEGRYWSSTENSTKSINILLAKLLDGVSSTRDRTNGFSVRCVYY